MSELDIDAVPKGPSKQDLRIKALEQELLEANNQITVLKRKVEAERFKKEEFVRWVDTLIEEQKELREQRFRVFGNEEYLIFFDNGEDYPDSMVAPVVMSADKFRELYYAREQLQKKTKKLRLRCHYECAILGNG